MARRSGARRYRLRPVGSATRRRARGGFGEERALAPSGLIALRDAAGSRLSSCRAVPRRSPATRRRSASASHSSSRWRVRARAPRARLGALLRAGQRPSRARSLLGAQLAGPRREPRDADRDARRRGRARRARCSRACRRARGSPPSPPIGSRWRSRTPRSGWSASRCSSSRASSDGPRRRAARGGLALVGGRCAASCCSSAAASGPVVGERSLLRRLLGAARADRLAARVRATIDGRLAALHAERPADFRASLALHALGTSVGALQLALFLAWLGVPFTLGGARRGVRGRDRRSTSSLSSCPGGVGAQEESRMVALRRRRARARARAALLAGSPRWSSSRSGRRRPARGSTRALSPPLARAAAGEGRPGSRSGEGPC